MKWLTPPQIAKRLGVNAERVRGWIVSEQLRAINLSDTPRPQWRVSEEDYQDFCARRANTTSKKRDPRKSPRKRRTQKPAIEFFK